MIEDYLKENTDYLLLCNIVDILGAFSKTNSIGFQMVIADYPDCGEVMTARNKDNYSVSNLGITFEENYFKGRQNEVTLFVNILTPFIEEICEKLLQKY